MTITIEESQRAGARLVFGLAGTSGEGKTYTALLLAYGLAGCDASKVGLLDTENKRGSLYSDILPGGQRFKRGDLYAPFSPRRYIDGIEAFQKAGVEVLVIDSVTHEWEGPGGCEEIANNSGKKMADWLTAKREHKKFINALLLCDMHVICCIRAREKTDFKDPRNPVSLGLQPVCEKNFMYEMTASFMMRDQGMRRDILKCPGELRSILGNPDGYIGIEEGKALRAWVDGAGADPLESTRNRIRLAASGGTGKLRAAWEATSKKDRAALGAEFLDAVKQQAADVDVLEQGDDETELPTPQGREDLLSHIRAKCEPGNSYGVTEQQILDHLSVKSLDDLSDDDLETLNTTWAQQVAEMSK